jgi:GNAT superfamily N-acetyltransferase
VIFRPATQADTEALRAVMAGSNGYAEPAARAMILAYAATWTPDEDVWVVQDARGLCGFHHLVAMDAQTLDLDLFFTADDRQGEGIGRRLFTHMIERARERGARKIVIVSNPQAANFYRKMGAVDDGIAPAGTFVGWERPRLLLHL